MLLNCTLFLIFHQGNLHFIFPASVRLTLDSARASLLRATGGGISDFPPLLGPLPYTAALVRALYAQLVWRGPF